MSQDVFANPVIKIGWNGEKNYTRIILRDMEKELRVRKFLVSKEDPLRTWPNRGILHPLLRNCALNKLAKNTLDI